SGRRFPRDGLAGRHARRRQAYCRQSARGQRFGKSLFERLRTGWGPVTVSAEPLHHGHTVDFREIAAFEPFGGSAGTRVATTSTTTGANLLVSGVAAGGTDASVLKYKLVRPNAQSTTLQAVRLGQVWSGKGSQPAILGGD